MEPNINHSINSDRYLTEIEQLSDQKTESLLAKKIFKCVTNVFKNPRLVRTAAQYGADHLANGKFAGNIITNSLKDVRKALSGSKSENFAKLERCVKYALEIENSLTPILVSNGSKRIKNDLVVSHSTKKNKNDLVLAETIKRIKDDLINLKPGESLAIPGGYKNNKGGHATIFYFERKDDGNFLVRHHNTGEGLLKHYNMSGKKFQTAMEIVNVEESNLCNSEFIDKILKLRVKSPHNNIEQLYELIDLLKGEIKEISWDKRLWSHGQFGGSCAIRSTLALSKSLLSQKEFQDLKLELKLKHLKKTFKYYKESGGLDGHSALVTLEIVKKLKVTYNKLNKPFPSALSKIQETIQGDFTKSSIKTSETSSILTYEEVFSKIYKCMASQRYQEAHKLLVRAKSIASNPNNLDIFKYYENFENLYYDCLKNKGNNHLTYDMLDLFADVSRQFLKKIDSLDNSQKDALNSQIEKLESFCNTVLIRYEMVHVKRHQSI